MPNRLMCSGVVSLSRTRVCLSFYVLSSLIVKKFRAWPITAVAPVELDEIDHSSSEKKSFSSYWSFSRSETKVKGSAVLRSKARCLRSPWPLVAAEAIYGLSFFEHNLVQKSPGSHSPMTSDDGFDCNSLR